MNEKFDLSDNDFLADKIREAYAKSIVSKNILKAGRSLKILEKNRRRDILECLMFFSLELVERIYYEDEYKFSNDDIKRLVDTTMEMLFQKTLAMSKADIEERYWGDPLEMVVTMCFVTEREFIISKEPSGNSYRYSKANADKYFRNELSDLCVNKHISGTQYKKALNKTYVNYLRPRILTKKVHTDINITLDEIRGTIVFLICWITGLATLFFLKLH